MKKRIILPILAALVVLGGCAMPPNQNEIDQFPVIQFGESVPENGDYILHFTAGEEIPTTVNIEGDIFQQPAKQVIKVKLKRDIYSYKEWMSYDKQHWLNGQDALGVKLDIKIPGYHHPKPGHITLNLSEKQKQP